MTKTRPEIHLLTCDEMRDLGMRVNPLLEHLEEEIGPEAVWALTGKYGGISAHIPTKERIAGSTLAKHVGETIVEWLCENVGYGNFRFPMGAHSRTALLMAHFRSVLRTGRSQQSIAKEMGCSVRTVGRAAERLRKAGFI